MPSLKISFACLGLLWLTASSAQALPTDRSQPISIQADRAEQLSLPDGETTEYFGNVLMSQGTLAISGEHITIHSKNRAVTRIIAEGNPAQLQQQTAADKPPLTAQALRIEYDITQQAITLLEKASIRQDEATVNSQRIYYNMATEQVKANGTSDGSSRVQMVLVPSKDNSEEASPPTEQEPHGTTDSQ